MRPNERAIGSFAIGEIETPPGQCKDLKIKISETYTAAPVFIPVTVVHGSRPGPKVFITAAVHGDELNGVEIVRRIRAKIDPKRLRGTLLLVPIANPIGFLTQNRALPDGRDLNRVFPGSLKGSIASQMAHVIFKRIVSRCDYGIDLHTAARGRTNLPHVRADLRRPSIRRVARAFGSEFIFDMKGEGHTLRYAACRRGVAVIVYEAGEPLKFQIGLIRKGVVGVKNVLAALRMYPFRRKSPLFQVVVTEHRWIRAKKGGILLVNVRPGDIIKKGKPIAFSMKPFGTKTRAMKAPYTGLVVGLSTLPVTYPGSAVCHLVKIGGGYRRIQALMRRRRLSFE